jgi:hypothetical protein
VGSLRRAATLAILIVASCTEPAPSGGPRASAAPAGAPTAAKASTVVSPAPADPLPATPAPYVPPPPAAAPPTPAPKPAAFIAFTSVPASVGVGGTATVRAKTSANASCGITVTYASGRSTAAGLEPRLADDFGAIEWTWVVAAGTAPGKYPIEIACGELGARVTFIVR